uniref:Reverse transcriptase domain-containing protein n=1 Tax=Tanacetum cinerariifolium TaxID=118510 RepID=A0A6L2JF91_TANCI|nr:hypothetical protein [Tanacetum cinerariifolium]
MPDAHMLQNKLPPKEKDSRSFVLPCIIANTTVSNALADLGENISIVPFSMFKRLGLGNPKPINMMIEIADRSMQSPKGIVQNVLVKIHNFIFHVDFVILDIIEDEKVPIILKRPMLATAHARIDINANKGANPSTDSPVYVINDYGGPEDLEELLMNDDINGDLGYFLQDNNLLPNFDAPKVIFFSPLADLMLSIGILLKNFKTLMLSDHPKNETLKLVRELSDFDPLFVMCLALMVSSIRKIQAVEQETRDLDVEIKQIKDLKASYGITTPQELCRNQIKEEMS